MTPFDPTRRRLLQGGTAALALATPFGGLLAARERVGSALVPTRCQATGLELLELPPGCEYRSFGWKGEPLADGTPTPGRHDGMAIVREHAGVLTLVRNHEEYSDEGAFTTGALVYDPMASGGCTVLEFDARAGVLRSARTGLAGTSFNCAGGATPWGTWLSGEEWVLGPGDPWRDRSRPVRFEQPHGFVFEVDPARLDAPRPLPALGRFQHEAAAVDPRSGIVYLTEDRSIAGFYRFLPARRGDLAAGGRLQMLALDGTDDVRGAQPRGQPRAVRWVDIADPGLAHTEGTRDAAGVVSQGLARGGTRFARLEGCWYRDGVVWFTSTAGGAAGRGQVWRYDVRAEQLAMFYESPDAATLDSPDNLTVTPRGALLLCEDGDREATLLHLLTRDGRLLPLARNAARLDGSHLGHAGDFRDREFAGVCMDAAGRWLFLNLQTPGISFAIRGPWRELGL